MDLVDSSDSASITDRKAGHDIGAGFKIKTDIFGLSGNARHSREMGTGISVDSSTKETKRHVIGIVAHTFYTFFREANNNGKEKRQGSPNSRWLFRRIGGNISLADKEWEASVSNPHYWDIINRDHVVPIWRMLDEELAESVDKIVNMSFKDRLSVNGVYHIRNIETNKILNWKPYSYDKGHGRIVATSPVMSGESSENSTWKFVRVPDQDEPDNQNERSYLRYDVDRVYIQPNSHPNDYLHASQNYPSPVTKREGQVSLRQIDDPSKRQLSDVWVIERCNAIHEDTRWKNIDLAMLTNRFVQKGDEFRLKCLDSGYLASHDKSMEEVKVVIDSRRFKLKNIPKIFGSKFKEVIILKESEVGDNTKMATWKIDP